MKLSKTTLPFSLMKICIIRKSPILTCVLAGLFLPVLLLVGSSLKLADASEPTPTPGIVEPAQPLADEVDNPLCSLALALSRASLNPPGLAVDDSLPAVIFVNPAVKAGDVPVYTLVSAVFDRAMDPSMLNGDTFFVSGEAGRIGGFISYITGSNVAVFEPDTPLVPNNTYTATVTTGARSRSGEYLPREIAWTFTTISGVSSARGDVTAARVSPYGDGMYVYFGDLHSHSGYSDGAGTPAVAFATARANGLDFFALTDHDIFLDQPEWQDTLVQANLATVEGQFIALRGFEFTHPKGHINVFNTDAFIRGDDLNYSNLANFYAWLTFQSEAIGQFNHPRKDATSDLNFNNFVYYPVADHKVDLRELTDSSQFFLSLNTGWHLGTLKNSDTHVADWGCCRLMGLVAPNLTKATILDALRARRTFFVSPFDRNLAVLMKANGYWMGSAIPNTSLINFNIKVYDPDPGGSSLRLKLYDNGVQVASATLPPTTLYTWLPQVQGRLGHYYYVEAYYPGWIYSAYSSPIWVERPPVAEAGPSQTAPPGTVITLDGSQSWDPDGNPLTYRWVRQSGPTVSLEGAKTVRPTFVAPETIGDIVFDLTVEDTGSLTASDVAVVTISDQPFLSISKSGPATAAPNELIEYTLTVTNSGVTPATGVVITDVVPKGATYVSGGTLLPSNVVSWTIPSLAARGGTAQVTFLVTATGGIANTDYQVSCAEGASAVGKVVVITNGSKSYLPVIAK